MLFIQYHTIVNQKICVCMTPKWGVSACGRLHNGPEYVHALESVNVTLYDKNGFCRYN